ncbi:Myb-like DNA-binding domain containing protein [Trichomonas vaginalis G3]|uniref:Myb-like DNA-binding domain containing protein n=1 Tax=Trichomonas vaginalis (strain ATCC PRA-98 / G3) TaxID=412133 RepID=A2FBF9_TRIV3|nr:RNA polymerase II transcription regulator recruiting protein [Trichomonas vaginalis G3]EAX97746.1 Myb-like DNA-binding domain containing protein [Trichomonas vaginalis G3]KAI5491179.1 RNA polymerase II transcription regulator recruiting protein [Trichomonas vaginalis G3]|eukprot:XP_001310676.1 Myb-like DNA-binding domain containing protein [Trichomonas vaginalis G3]
MTTDSQVASERQKRRRKFTPEEDQKLISYVQFFGEKWAIISKLMETRTCKQCRERYREYLNPNITNLAWTPEEDNLLIQLYTTRGSKWAEFSKILRGRSDGNIKNRWYIYLKNKVNLPSPPPSSEVSEAHSPEEITEVITAFEPPLFDFQFTEEFDAFNRISY